MVRVGVRPLNAALVHPGATVMMPIDFLRVPATALLHYLAYSQTTDTVTAAGARWS